MVSALISADDARWTSVLARLRHDVYHLPEYCVLAGKHEGGMPAAFYCEDAGREMLIPVLVRQVPNAPGGEQEWRDITSPYGYPGPVTTDTQDGAWVNAALERFRDLARAQGLVSAFLRLHPLCGLSAPAVAAHGTVVYHGPVVYLDLTKPLQSIEAETRENHRRDIRRLERTGFTVHINDWSLYSSFCALYHATMERVEAPEFYLFSSSYFDDIRRLLAERLHFAAVLAPNGDVAAAGLFTATDRMLGYHLGGSAAPYLQHAASKLMFHVVRRWGKAEGFSVLNLGGGVGGRPGPLLNFKAGFSPVDAPFHTLRIVFDEDRYELLTRLGRPRHECSAAADFFPAYRQAFQGSGA